MKTKVTFDPKDLKGLGQMIIRDSFPVNCKDYEFGASVAYKVGWMNSSSAKNEKVLISLQDGMILRFASEQEICDHLNADTYGFRPMSKKEIKKILGIVGNRFYS